MSASSLFVALNLVWGGYELLLSRRRRASDGGALNRGTLQQLWRVLSAAVAAAVVLAYSGLAHWPQGWGASLQWAGCALIGSGLALRVCAIQVLARWFTVDVTIQPDHQLVRRGPYRWLRHPSYTGALLAFYGLALGMGNALSVAALVVPVTLVFLHRIRIEEAALQRALPVAYPAHAKQSHRLLPLVG
ncbi:protein-S-isoprenylcysteine methyltransferase [Xanthomonas nasturtii]|uniref:Phosphatidylethanolamine N-methyltransferase family protein n=1 Tax=Xanthomonas nasturtii TaxID=1843581 RepID=A0ABT0LRB5_9XANT|nr:PEMT/PEM2 methyltransferase family protein [Xanthomonas nasturtii]MCL1501085.1 phosphatidylethanolamine N-methyltransferase family protein [Xanthomonas nasturtii]MCL1504797.1 phosphatidylethanolamine N-methyltransferase family protein [Xanthomonas nasturtii]MCL1524392.1 phosphatidylethanolamine N-methyltransferase family protein [Xanthomonas nasturtii]MCL1526825.1 phosphatidylethanolamine N-methyltransferase family protein [Xanthomonas nasturtii]MCL1534516.1 phosphatidylethanolamine N-methy